MIKTGFTEFGKQLSIIVLGGIEQRLLWGFDIDDGEKMMLLKYWKLKKKSRLVITSDAIFKDVQRLLGCVVGVQLMNQR